MTSRRASDIAGRRVKELRDQLDWTREDLAKECARLGAKITADVIVNIETGRRDKATGERRRDVTVDELVMLAQALKTSPTDLLLPGPGETLAITPEVEAEPLMIAEWFAGRAWSSGLPPVPFDRNTAAVRLYHAAWEAWEAYKAADRAANWARKSGDESAAEAHSASAEERLRDFGRAIDAMIDTGLQSPWVAPGIAQRMSWMRHADQLRVIDLSDLDEV